MSETSKTLRAIAHNYIKAAEHLEAAEWLAASVESSPHEAAAKTLADIEPMETIGDDAAIGDAGPMVVDAAVWREPVEPTGERHPNIGAALDRCRDVLGWDPDTMSSIDACSAIAELMSLYELDCAEVLEKRRWIEMTPRKASRSTVLTAIAKRRAELEAAGVQELARRVVACPGWRWMPGMRVSYVWGSDARDRFVAVDAEHAHLVIEDPGEDREVYRMTRKRIDSFARDCVPDLDDPATLGCLLALVREAWDDATIHVRAVDDPEHGHVWMAFNKYGQAKLARLTWSRFEAERLVVALEAAPRREASP